MVMIYLCCFSFERSVVVPGNSLPLFYWAVYFCGIAPQVHIKFYQLYWLGTFPGTWYIHKAISKLADFRLMTYRTIQNKIPCKILHMKKKSENFCPGVGTLTSIIHCSYNCLMYIFYVFGNFDNSNRKWEQAVLILLPIIIVTSSMWHHISIYIIGPIPSTISS